MIIALSASTFSNCSIMVFPLAGKSSNTIGSTSFWDFKKSTTASLILDVFQMQQKLSYFLPLCVYRIIPPPHESTAKIPTIAKGFFNRTYSSPASPGSPTDDVSPDNFDNGSASLRIAFLVVRAMLQNTLWWRFTITSRAESKSSALVAHGRCQAVRTPIQPLVRVSFYF